MEHDTSAVEDALRSAATPAGVVRLLECLGFEPLDGGIDAPSDGLAGARDPVDDGGAARPVATGAGILALLRVDEGAAAEPEIRRLLGRNPGRPVLFVVADARFRSLTFASGGLDGRPRWLSVRRPRPRRGEVEALSELCLRPGDGATASLARLGRALERSAVSRRFFRDFRAQRDAVAAAWTGLPDHATDERDQLALLFLSRLMFLYFLQRDGVLAGDTEYMHSLVREWTSREGESFFGAVLRPLFFGALNTRPEARTAQAGRLGNLPYLNGGLFEPHHLERRFAAIDLPDPVGLAVFDALLERYRFAARRESRTGGSIRIHPETLGNVFENLMAADRRGRTGTFFTPAHVVDRLVAQSLQGFLAGQPGMDWRAAGMVLREAAPRYTAGEAPADAELDAVGDAPLEPPVLPSSMPPGHGAPDRQRLLASLRDLRVLDPACGSGAFLLGSLDLLTQVRRGLGEREGAGAIRRDLAARGLFGVDLQPDAALLCALRLWLALSETGRSGRVDPLPNLDRQIRQGDALLDPLDMAAHGDAGSAIWRAAALDVGVRRARRVSTRLARRYVDAGPETRASLSRRLIRAERRLAKRWLGAARQRIEEQHTRVLAAAADVDLFGDAAAVDGAARLEALDRMATELSELEAALEDSNALPFFSFGVHFHGAREPGFHLVVSNPPWVRSHAWPAAANAAVRSRFRVCGGGRPNDRLPAVGGQVDLASLFIERGLQLLRTGGVLGMIVPSKTLRARAGAGARRLLLRHCRMLLVEDYGLDQRAIFRADSFAASLVARKERGPANGRVRVMLHARRGPALRFSVPFDELPLSRTDARSPWLIAPPDARRALRSMQRSAPTLAESGLRVRRGVMTGANDVLLFDGVEPKLGGLARVRTRGAAEGPSTIIVETAALAPLIRGADIRPFRAEPSAFIAWSHDDDTAEPVQPPPRMARYLAGHRARLRARRGWRAGLPDACLFRLGPDSLGHRVAWRDLAPRLEAAWLPPRSSVGGLDRPLVPLNTVYFVPCERQTALLLAALLNALPARVFTRSIAERAKDAHFRFFAWTVEALPVPRLEPRTAEQHELIRIAEAAHAGGGLQRDGMDELDDRVARLYGLGRAATRALRDFDGWLDAASGRDGRSGLDGARPQAGASAAESANGPVTPIGVDA